MDENKYDAFHATTYTVSPINLQHGKLGDLVELLRGA